jgi:hypothetical protein
MAKREHKTVDKVSDRLFSFVFYRLQLPSTSFREFSLIFFFVGFKNASSEGLERVIENNIMHLPARALAVDDLLPHDDNDNEESIRSVRSGSSRCGSGAGLHRHDNMGWR